MYCPLCASRDVSSKGEEIKTAYKSALRKQGCFYHEYFKEHCDFVRSAQAGMFLIIDVSLVECLRPLCASRDVS